jgi:hypothetical protein
MMLGLILYTVPTWKKREGKDIWAQRGYIWATTRPKNPGDFRCKGRQKKTPFKHGSGLEKKVEEGEGILKTKKSQKEAVDWPCFISCSISLLFSLVMRFALHGVYSDKTGTGRMSS